MSIFDEFYVPGMGDPVVSTESEFWWGRPEGLQYDGGRILSSAVDATNTPTTTLRRGLIVGQITATKKWKQYAVTATDGSQSKIGVLLHGRNMLDPRTGVAGDREAMILLSGGGLKVASLIGFDENARRLLSGRFLFDDGRYNYGGTGGVVAKATSYTVLAADAGTFFTTLGAVGAVTFTLPALANVGPGWEATFFNEADQDMIVAAPTGKLVAFNNAAATSIAFSTTSEQIGSGVRIVMNSAGTFYLALPILGSETATPTIA